MHIAYAYMYIHLEIFPVSVSVYTFVFNSCVDILDVEIILLCNSYIRIVHIKHIINKQNFDILTRSSKNLYI